jgi:hypothetical protein
MNTAISDLTAQPISRSTLLELLSSKGLAYENLGAGVLSALACLEQAQAFYDLPAALVEPLQRFEHHLRFALAELEQATKLI